MKICKTQSKIFFILLFISFLSVSCSPNQPNTYSTILKIKDKKIFVDIANTESKRAQGLSKREPLKNDQGMLFVFEKSGKYGFWMKEMIFDLDLIWINNNQIVDITHSVPYPQNSNVILKTYYPRTEIDKVLEVNSGWSKKNNIVIGDLVELE